MHSETSTQSLGTSLPFLDDIQAAGKQFSDQASSSQKEEEEEEEVIKILFFLNSYESDVRFSHRFATSLTLKQYACNVLGAGSTESAPLHGIFLHTATFSEEASRMGISDKIKMFIGF